MNTHEDFLKELICVYCKKAMNGNSLLTQSLQCISCKQVYPVINNIPILINETDSIFSFSDFTDRRNLFFDLSRKGRLRATISKLTPSMGGNNLGKRNFIFLQKLLVETVSIGKPRVLVIGGSIIGDGMSDFVNSQQIEVVEGDVSFGPRTKIIFDGHSIPYNDESFDCVVVQAVLEHVIDPVKCVREIHRVLKREGMVYAETPFMQQLHGGAYDFTRYTRSGHRRLFQYFKEIKSGNTAGSATSLGWSYEYFLLSLFGYNDWLRFIVKFFARFTGFWIKYFDYITRYNPHDSDGASGFFFMGRKSLISISDKEIINYGKYNLR